MKLKVRKSNADGVARMETSGSVKEVLVNEDIFNPGFESISVCFRGKSSSGIVEFSPGELEEIYRSVKKRIHLIKGMKKFIVRHDETPL